MELGVIPPMFGMGVADSFAEVVRLQQEAAQHALDQMQRIAQQQEHFEPSVPAGEAANAVSYPQQAPKVTDFGSC
jgi:hemolysin activation/secretion protein